MIGIPGNTISGLAQSQIAHAASFQSYGNFISDQYGTRKTPPSQAAVSGGGGGYEDPRYQSPYLPTTLASTMMGAGRTGVDAGLGVLSTAGAFGLAPRMFDPFTSTLGLMGSGYRWGGASGAIGFGAAGAGMYMGAGAIMNAGMGQVMMGGQQQAQLSGVFGGGINRMNTPMMGMPSFGQQVQFGNMMSGMSSGSGGSMSMDSLTGLLGQGLAGGSFGGASSMGDFQGKFKQLVGEVRTIAETFNSSLNEAYSVMQRVQGMGFYRPGEAARAGQAFSGLARATGMQADEMMSAASSGADMWGSMGGSRAMGASVVGGMAGQLSALTGAGAISGSGIRDMFGGAPLGQAIPQLAGRLSQYSAQFGSTRYGQRVLGAMMDPTTGAIDSGRARNLGSMDWGEIQSQYDANMRTSGARKMLTMNAGDLSRQMSEQLGPQWAAMGIGAMSQSKGGGVSSVEDYMGLIHGGIPKQELDIMNRMASFGPELKGFLKARGEQALQDGMAEAKQGAGSWETVKERLKQAFVEPFTAPLRKFGREVMGGLQGWTSDTIDSFLGRQPGLLNDGNRQAINAHASIFGMGSVNPGAMGGGPGGGLSSMGGIGGGLVNDWLPGGIGNAIEGGQFGGMGGFATSHYNPAMTGVAAMSLPMFGGANAINMVGRGITGLGGALGGGGGAAISALGWGARAAGRVAGGLGLGMAIGDVATNFGPAALRGETFMGINPSAAWGGGALIGQGGGLGTFGPRASQMYNFDPVGSSSSLGLDMRPSAPGIQPLGIANDMSMMYPDAADPAMRGPRQLSFANRGMAEKAAQAYYGAVTDPGGAFSQRLSAEEMAHMENLGGTVSTNRRPGEDLLTASLRIGRNTYDRLGDSSRDRGIREKIGGTDPIRMLAMMNMTHGLPDTLRKEALGMAKQTDPRDSRYKALSSILGGWSVNDSLNPLADPRGLEKGDVSDLISGSLGTPGIVQGAAAWKQETNKSRKKLLMDDMYDKFMSGDVNLMPKKLNDMVRKGLGGSVTREEFERTIEQGAIETFSDPETQAFIRSQGRELGVTKSFSASTGLGLHLGVLQGDVGAGASGNLAELMLVAGSPAAIYDQSHASDIPSYTAALNKETGQWEAQGNWRGDMYSQFHNMSLEKRRELAGMATRGGPGSRGARVLGATAGVYNEVEREFGGHVGGRKKLTSGGLGDTVVGADKIGGFLNRFFKGSPNLPGIQAGLPEITAGGDSYNSQMLIHSAALNKGYTDQEADVIMGSMSSQGEGKGGLTRGELQRLMEIETDRKIRQATTPGGSGEGSPETAMKNFGDTLQKLTDRMRGIIEQIPE